MTAWGAANAWQLEQGLTPGARDASTIYLWCVLWRVACVLCVGRSYISSILALQVSGGEGSAVAVAVGVAVLVAAQVEAGLLSAQVVCVQRRLVAPQHNAHLVVRVCVRQPRHRSCHTMERLGLTRARTGATGQPSASASPWQS